MQTARMKALVQKLNDMFHDKFSKKDAENLTFLITAYEKVVSDPGSKWIL